MPVRFKVEKGLTKQRDGETWDREIYTLELEVPDLKDVEGARVWAVKTIDGWLIGKAGAPSPVPAPAKVPEFDSEELMKHKGWKGRRLGEGDYAEGSLAWGWDFRENFSKETISVLEKGPLTISGYEFSLTERFVQTKKVK